MSPLKVYKEIADIICEYEEEVFQGTGKLKKDFQIQLHIDNTEILPTEEDD